jgi:hypothetical protein
LRLSTEDVGHRFAVGRRRVDPDVEGDQRPSRLASALHQAREIDERPRKAIKLANHERGGVAAVKRGNGGLEAGAPVDRASRRDVLDQPRHSASCAR